MTENKIKLNYEIALKLKNFLDNISTNALEPEHRGLFFLVRKQLEPAFSSFSDKKTFILLMNGGIEETNENGINYIMPKYETRDNFKGDDEKYLDHFKSVNSKINKIKTELLEVGCSDSGVEIEPFMSENSFNDLASKVGSLDFESFREVLIKK